MSLDQVGLPTGKSEKNHVSVHGKARRILGNASSNRLHPKPRPSKQLESLQLIRQTSLYLCDWGCCMSGYEDIFSPHKVYISRRKPLTKNMYFARILFTRQTNQGSILCFKVQMMDKQCSQVTTVNQQKVRCNTEGFP